MEKYQRNIIRNIRLKGLEYVSYKEKEVPSKAPQKDVNCKCHLKCYLKYTAEIIREQWETIYSLESKNTQDTYLQASMWVMPVKRRRKNRSPNENNEQAQENVSTDDLADRKSHSYKYNLKVNGVLTEVRMNQEKTDDIEKLMGYPVGYEAFYDIIIQWPTTDHELPELMPEDQIFCIIKTYCSA
ncbi:hypothetical protein WA026_015324 [Henosepilachna vigintioctopunctata]|uniref:Uncharacterized protein n=1 Tax=Henosepilachna vigintioctopunctata TaxID=420089 RepID=A0AAW1UMH5_9CUCU